MNIIVCIKQVPDTNDMRIDPKTNNLIREGVPAVVNPTDLNAIEEALRFKDTFGASVSVLTMGPPQAEQSLREALAMGADQAYLLTDRAFGGADTLATSYALWKGIQKIEESNGKTDFVFFGKVAIDGETGQVGPGLAVRLGYPVITYTSKTSVVDLENKFVEAERRVDDGVERVRVPIPCALTVTEAANEPRQPTIDGMIRAKQAKINLLNKDIVNADPKRIGLGGSPTYVKKVVVPPAKKKGEIKEATDPKEAAKWLVDRLVQIGAFGKKVSGGVIPDKPAPTQADPTPQPSQNLVPIQGSHGDVWVYVEQRYGQAARVSWELMGEGKRLSKIYGTKLCAVVLGSEVDGLVGASCEYGADLVYFIQHPVLREYRSETYGKAFAYLSNKYHPEVILMGGTYNGRDLAGVLATLIETGLIADCTSLDVDEKGGFNGTRPDFGGKELSTIVCPRNKPTMASVRTRVMKMPARVEGKIGEVVQESIELEEDQTKEKILSFTPMERAGELLENSDIIVSGGRGLGNPKNFKIVEDLAKVLGGQVGATRAVVYLGWISKDHQVGQTGVTVRARLYFAIGVSGAIQHLVGMENSDTVVAINRDPDAPIFGLAHYGIVGDLFQVVPLVVEEIKSRGLAAAA
ncbi:MAG: FAD-binding protein [Thaumarchaeota archaeon]|nr:FAD-binding protein [Nitrososphaerota archaeon]